jgi:hypothetical protein
MMLMVHFFLWSPGEEKDPPPEFSYITINLPQKDSDFYKEMRNNLRAEKKKDGEG